MSFKDALLDEATRKRMRILGAIADVLKLAPDEIAEFDKELESWATVHSRMNSIESTLDTILTDQQKIRETQERIESWQQQRDQRRADES